MMENYQQKNRKNAILLSLLLALIFAYPTLMAASDVVIDGSVQWTSLILTLLFGIWVLLPFAVILFYKGDETKQRDEKNKQKFSRILIIVGSIVWGVVFFGFGLFALTNYFGHKDIKYEDLHRIDGTISKVAIESVKSRKTYTSVLLIEYPQYRFYIPFVDKTLKSESSITLYVSVRDYQRVIEKNALTNKQLHTQDQYAPFVVAYESDNSCVTLSDYNEWSRTNSKWGLYVGIVCILFGIGGEIWIFRRKGEREQTPQA
ncbi:MAG: hypothetical protein J6X16_02165 [Bacteroidales bacterium]|nr:hypothetical protein [Bacteroidales bacterium]